MGVPYLVVLILRILLFRVLYYGPLFSETPTKAEELVLESAKATSPGLVRRLMPRMLQLLAALELGATFTCNPGIPLPSCSS